eukprot:c10001_g1_i1.p1 GENE.c10001_g1_i1~~c10001_g1_i1.p1  ORF type:complete len:1705 (+),score=344.48 c10001_g1_i1:111-5225(+)
MERKKQLVDQQQEELKAQRFSVKRRYRSESHIESLSLSPKRNRFHRSLSSGVAPTTSPILPNPISLPLPNMEQLEDDDGDVVMDPTTVHEQGSDEGDGDGDGGGDEDSQGIHLSFFGGHSDGRVTSPRLRSLASQLQTDDPTQILLTLTTLCDALSVATEDNISGESVEVLVPPLLALVAQGPSPDIELLAARAISNLMEAQPASRGLIVRCGGCLHFCEKLLTIEFIDLAEESLRGLEKLSVEHGSSLLECNAITAMLAFVDFFGLAVQRSVLQTVSNICRSVNTAHASAVREAIPQLSAFLHNDDTKLLELACASFESLTRVFENDKPFLVQLLPKETILALVGIIKRSDSLPSQILSSVMHTLQMAVKSSPPMQVTYLECSVVDAIYCVLQPNPASDSLVRNRPPQQIAEALTLARDLLPIVPPPAPLPPSVTAPTPSSPPSSRRHSTRAQRKALKHVSRSRTRSEDLTTSPRSSPRSNPSAPRIPLPTPAPPSPMSAHIARNGQQLLELAMQMHKNSINTSTRGLCRDIVLRVIVHCQADAIVSLASPLHLSAFVFSLLNSTDSVAILDALNLTRVLMEKVPDVFCHVLWREGVVNQCEQLCERPAVHDHKHTRTTSPPPSVHKRSSSPPVPISSPRAQSSPAPSSSSPVPHLPPPSLSPFRLRFWHPRSSPVAISGSKSEKTEIEALVSYLLEHHFSKYDFDDSVLTELTSISQSLALFAGEAETAAPLFKRLAQLLSADHGVTVFELTRSSFPSSLLSFLSNLPPHSHFRSLSSIWTHSLNSDHLKHGLAARVRVLVNSHITVGESSDNDQSSAENVDPSNGVESDSTNTKSNIEKSTTTQSKSLLALLVDLLLNSLNQVEQYPLFRFGSNDANRLSSLRILTEPLRLRLKRMDGEVTLKEYSSAPVVIDPLSQFTSVEEFLFPKVSAESSEIDSLTLPSTSTPTRRRSRPRTLSFRPQRSRDESDEQGEGESDRVVDPDRDDPPLFDDKDQLIRSSSVVDICVADSSSPQPSPLAHPILPSPALTPSHAALPPPATPSTPSRPRTTSDTANSSPRIVFVFNGQIVDTKSTVLQVLLNHAAAQMISSNGSLETLWHEVHTIQYSSSVPQPLFTVPASPTPTASSSVCLATASPVTPRHNQNTNDLTTVLNVLDRDRMLVSKLAPHCIANWLDNQSDMLSDILLLLRTLHSISTNWNSIEFEGYREGPLLPPSHFISHRLTSKLLRQLDEPLVLCGNCLPQWCHNLPAMCPFLFTFDSRVMRFVSTALGAARGLHVFQNQQRQQSSDSEIRIARIHRQKVRIHRSKLLESALKVMMLYGTSQSMLEIEYYDEVGTGTGPTMEFYSLVSDKLRERSRKLWVDSCQNPASEFVESACGLFPQPIPFADEGRSSPNSKTKRIDMFRFAGQLIAKSIMDRRLVELPLSAPFIKLVLASAGQIGYDVDWNDLTVIVPHLAKTLRGLMDVCRQKQHINASHRSHEDKQSLIQAIRFDECPIEDLCLTFTLPNDPLFELQPNGAATAVTIDNVELFVELMVEAYLGKGVERQVTAFREGFSSVFDVCNLTGLLPQEVEILICGEHKQLDIEAMKQHIKTDHGFHPSSSSVLTLFEVIDEMTPSEQRQFVMFVTGSPRLPPGGLSSLTPKLTIVRKVAEPGRSADEYLPSVMTCANYLKLPEYSSKELMRQRLMTAILDGQGSFHLS